MLAIRKLGVAMVVAAFAGCAGAPEDGAASSVGVDPATRTTVAALGPETAVAWVDASGAVTGVNAGALRTDFVGGGQVGAFKVIRRASGGYALAKVGSDAGGACHTQMAALSRSGLALHLQQVNATYNCIRSLCPVGDLDPEGGFQTADSVVVDEPTLAQGFCRPNNDANGCYCVGDGSACQLALGSLPIGAFLVP